MSIITRLMRWMSKGVAAIPTALFILFAATTPASAAGLLISDGGFGGVLEIKEHDVKVVINNGIAVTHVTQVFHNTEKRQVEALYTFPVPRGASVANFSMWINGKEMIGEVLEKEKAREIYNSYKQKRQDPGLLEQKDYKTFEMRIFPIGPEADQRVQITYYQELEIDHDRAVYIYPLATATRKDLSSRTTGRFAVNLEVESAIPITRIESPSHRDAFVVANHSDTYKLASLEASGGSLSSDVVIQYDMARPVSGIDMITSRRNGENGYFLLTLTAGKDLTRLDPGMDYIFLLDISGSMANDGKLIISKEAVEAFINELGDNDRFEVMTFNVAPNAVFSQLRPAVKDTKNRAGEFLASQQARGGTVLSPAMTAAYKYGNPDRTLNVIILSDGMTDQGERAPLLQMISSRPKNARVFCIGVGNEVNRPLLEQLAEDSGGLAAFISSGDNFALQAKAFRRKLMHPVAANLEITVNGVKAYDIEPQKLPNLFHGSPIRILGRYSGTGTATINFKADIQGKSWNQSFQLEFPEKDSDNPEIERMWAWKRVDQLLKQADRTNSRDKVIPEIVQLGESYSIVTEYTSFLVLENDNEYQRWKIERRNLRRIEQDRSAQQRLRERLDTIRNKAATDIGPLPQVKETVAANPPPKPQVSTPAPKGPPQITNPQPMPSSRPRENQSWSFDIGGGPVCPLFVGAAYWLRKRKSQKQ